MSAGLEKGFSGKVVWGLLSPSSPVELLEVDEVAETVPPEEVGLLLEVDETEPLGVLPDWEQE